MKTKKTEKLQVQGYTTPPTSLLKQKKNTDTCAVASGNTIFCLRWVLQPGHPQFNYCSLLTTNNFKQVFNTVDCSFLSWNIRIWKTS